MLSVYLSMIDTQEDRDKFERLFHQYERCLKYTAQNILGDEHLAEDAVQETFIRIIGCLGKIDETEEHKTAGFLMTVVKNIAYNIKRKQSKTSPLRPSRRWRSSTPTRRTGKPARIRFCFTERKRRKS